MTLPRFLTTEDWTSATSNSGSIALHADNAAPTDTWQGASSMDDDVSYAAYTIQLS